MARVRKCKNCGEKKPADQGLQTPVMWFCSTQCAYEYQNKQREKQRAKQKAKAERLHREKEKAERRDLRARKEALKTNSQWNKEAQAAFNSYIRIRDYGKPCSSCGKPFELSLFKGLNGHLVDAGHYRSRGAAAHLRFNVFNVHGQCVNCNRDKSGNVVDYRIHLIERIGLERVERLEHDNTPRKFDIEYLKRVKRIFTKKAKLYKHFRGLE